jgi:hypothetical protein
MKKESLEYNSLSILLAPYAHKGLSESASFLNWFLENIFRLDDVAAQDAICDKSNDKGIDGIYVDEFSEEILFFQAKIRQNPAATIGDVSLKEFSGSLAQFNSPSNIDKILSGNANPELKKLLISQNIKSHLEDGFSIKGVFLSNSDPDINTTQYINIHSDIRLYDREKICSEFVDLTLDSGVDTSFSFSCETSPLEFEVANLAKLFLFPASGAELVNLPGISDGQLFSQNVRLSLGNTDVNKAIMASLKKSAEHKKFPLFHNGITLLCDKATYENDKLTVTNFVVVNGAQSLTALFRSRSDITSDLRILLKIIEVSGNEDLSKQITQISNTQNAIRPRDMRSNHQIQLRLKREFEALLFDGYVFEVKRGESLDGENVITNDEAGRLLLAFDLEEPYYCHQIYKVFDEYYARIFGRPEVTAKRIIFVHMVMQRIIAQLPKIENRAFAGYTLTRFFLLDVFGQIMKKDALGASLIREPMEILLDADKRACFFDILDQIISTITIDLNYETAEKGEGFDYKSLLKSQKEIVDLRQKLLRAYERDVARKKADTIETLWKAKYPE